MIDFCNCKECGKFRKADSKRPDVCEDCAYEDSLVNKLGDTSR